MSDQAFIYARLETAHFVFDGIFQTREYARQQMFDAWERHCLRLGFGNLWAWSDLEDSVEYRELMLDQVYRNGITL